MTITEAGLAAVLAVIGGGNVWNWLASRGKTKVDLIALSHQIASDTVTAMETRIAALEKKIGDLTEQVETLSGHVETLEGVIRALGATPPPRPRRKEPE